ncbi:MAG: hypothetical protein NTX03_08655 [Bacteroidetes bacterium]|nr:hypothetical protein [Bacteroidota bacterium]
MKAKISFLFLFIIQIISAKSQEYKLIFLVDTPTKFITTDAFKNLFIITTDNAIIKYDSAGKKLAAQRFVTEFGLQ